MHSQDYTHNDLHDKNVVLNPDPQNPALALIDFGNTIQGHALSAKAGYMRDGNAAWRWAAFLAQCPADAQWSELARGAQMRPLSDNFKVCMRDVWGADQVTLDAFEHVLQGNVEETDDMGIEALFNSPFIQSHLPEFQAHYSWEGSNGCQGWSDEEKTDRYHEVEFQNHFKCDTIPTYAQTIVDTVHNCRRRRASQTIRQCPIQTSACYTSVPGIIWACGGGLIRQVHCDAVGVPLDSGHTGTFEGACLNQNHAAYKFAKTWES